MMSSGKQRFSRRASRAGHRPGWGIARPVLRRRHATARLGIAAYWQVARGRPPESDVIGGLMLRRAYRLSPNRPLVASAVSPISCKSFTDRAARRSACTSDPGAAVDQAVYWHSYRAAGPSSILSPSLTLTLLLGGPQSTSGESTARPMRSSMPSSLRRAKRYFHLRHGNREGRLPIDSANTPA